MLKSRKTKLIYILVLVFSITAMSIGFAAFSTNLNLASSANVKPNSANFGVKFSTSIDSVVEDEVTSSDITSGLTATNGVIDNTGSPKLTNLSVNFTSPGQYVEYSFYAYNAGEYNAYLNSVNFYGEKVCTAGEEASESLVVEACKAINMKVTIDNIEYTETTPVTDHVLNKNVGEEIRLRIEYDSNGEAVDGDFSVKFSELVLIYSTINDSTYIPDDGFFAKLKLLNIVKEDAVSDVDVSFEGESAGTYIRQGTENDSYPIYYYRGAVTNNNLKFAGFCWKIVRTTETGGVKLIYNGVPAGDGSCNNTGTASQLANTSAFNFVANSPADAGYMHGTRYTASSRDLSSQTDTYIYGNDVTWDGEKYTLINTRTSSSWSADRTNLATRYHYTCFSTSNNCESVYYITDFESSSDANYLTLTDGIDIEDAKKEMFGDNENFTNLTSSTIKKVIDSWYEANMVSYTSKLEDTIWCNDREFSSGSLKSKDDVGSNYSYFSIAERVSNGNFVPKLSCSNVRDSFTVDGAIGNGKLTYPVGLLTADEEMLAGIGTMENSYLYTGQSWWSLSSFVFCQTDVLSILVSSSGSDIVEPFNLAGVRPSVSLKAGTKISSGAGSAMDPYVVE